MTWSEDGRRENLSAFLAPYTVRSARAARRLARISARFSRRVTR